MIRTSTLLAVFLLVTQLPAAAQSEDEVPKTQGYTDYDYTSWTNLQDAFRTCDPYPDLDGMLFEHTFERVLCFSEMMRASTEFRPPTEVACGSIRDYGALWACGAQQIAMTFALSDAMTDCWKIGVFEDKEECFRAIARHAGTTDVPALLEQDRPLIGTNSWTTSILRPDSNAPFEPETIWINSWLQSEDGGSTLSLSCRDGELSANVLWGDWQGAAEETTTTFWLDSNFHEDITFVSDRGPHSTTPTEEVATRVITSFEWGAAIRVTRDAADLPPGVASLAETVFASTPAGEKAGWYVRLACQFQN